jgi:hypothetical protein
MGFGWQVTILTFALTPIIYNYLRNQEKFKSITKLLWFPALFVTGCLSIAFWQTPTTLLESGHSEYVINEILAPAAGYNPYQQFVPQYSFLLGWMLKPIVVSLGVVNGTTFLVNFLTVLGYTSLLIMVYFARLSWPTLPFPLLLLAVIPFCSPTPGWNRISFIGPASTLLSGPPIRILGGMVVGAATIFVARSVLSNSKVKLQVVFLGMLCSLIVWNNLDFGLAATLASTILIMVCGFTGKSNNKSALFLHIVGQFIGHLVVLIILRILGATPNWDLFGWFARQFGAGFGAITIEMPGAVNLAFPLIMGSAITGLYYIVKNGKFTLESDKDPVVSKFTTAIIAAYFGMFSGFALPYYVNRSFHAGQMSILYIPLATALIATTALMVGDIKKNQISNLRNSFPSLILAFMMATVYLIPNPSIELKRINGGNPNGTFPRPPLVSAINEVPNVKNYANEKNMSLGFYGEGGNYVKMLTGVDSVNIFNSPLDMFQSNSAVELSCNNLAAQKKDLLVLTDSAEQTFAWEDKSLCNGLYFREDIPGVGLLGVRKK